MLGYDRVFTIQPVGRCGGLALFWKNSVKIDFKFFDKNLLDLQVQFGAANFYVSCIYGDPDFNRRKVVWERVSRVGINRLEGWIMVGDFNDICHNGEKIGGPRRSDSMFKPFNEMLRACHMVELPSNGNRFTWAGRRYDLWIQSRLDRAFGNDEWFRSFPASNQLFLEMRGSDHRPVLVNLIASQDSYRGQFRFDSRFLHKPRVEEAILQAWGPSENGFTFPVAKRLRDCRRSLSSWKRENDLNSFDNIRKIELALEGE